jgi:uncharacterized protein YbaR (Trm112 family)
MLREHIKIHCCPVKRNPLSTVRADMQSLLLRSPLQQSLKQHLHRMHRITLGAIFDLMAA